MRNPAFLVLLLLFAADFASAADDPVVIPDRAGDFQNGVYHSGFMLEELDEMAGFLARYSSLKPISRTRLPNGGERMFLADARGQRLELLSDPRLKGAPPAPAYPRDAARALAHLAIEVDDAASVRERLASEGYEIVLQVPDDFADGYVVSEVDAHRVLFVRGPGGVAVEFFEIRKQQP
jgi:catechol 2,3-dioxygenase-like lactoylglutathione lyase family enzyme